MNDDLLRRYSPPELYVLLRRARRCSALCQALLMSSVGWQLGRLFEGHPLHSIVPWILIAMGLGCHVMTMAIDRVIDRRRAEALAGTERLVTLLGQRNQRRGQDG
jgi:hypothetical protein